MIFLFYVALFLLLTTVSIVVVMFFIFTLDSLIRGHDLSTSKQVAQALVKIIKQYKPTAKNFYDLGCARGTLAMTIKKELPDLEVHATDNSAIRIFFAKIKARIFRYKINFKKQDIFDIDLNRADIVYTYLWYDLMPPLEKKLQNELKPGTLIITNTSSFPRWQSIHRVMTYPKISKTPDHGMLFVYLKK